MVNPKVLELLRKYADEREPTSFKGTPAPADRAKLEDIAHEFQMKFRAVIAELEHDAGLLKLREFDKEMFQLMVGIWRHLEKIYLSFNSKDPYQTAQELIAYLKNRHTKSVIDNLIFLTEHHVKKTNVDFKPNPFMVNPQVRGLKLLLQLENEAKEVRPKTAPPPPAQSTLQQTWRPPSSPSIEAVKIPILPPLKNITPLPPTAPESPMAKRKDEAV